VSASDDDAPSDLVGLLVRAASGPAQADDETDDRILDAALDEAARAGTRATTMDGVALRAGVGRMTVFRRFGSKGALLDRLMLRELRRFLADVDRALDPIEDPRERVAEAFVACVRLASSHPLIARLVRDEPGATFDRLTRGEPSALELGRAFVAVRLRADPGVSAQAREHAEEVADVLVRLATTYVLVPSPAVDIADEAAARAFARRTLGVLISPS
jgi:AcrR family transcriptional regulator